MKKNRIVYSLWGICQLKILRIMKLIAFIMLFGFMQVSANIYSQSANIRLDIRKSNLKNVIQQIQSQTEFTFFYSPEDIEHIVVEDVDVKKASLEETLDKCLHGSNLEYEIKHKAVILRKSKIILSPREELSKQKTKTVKGKVTSKSGEPIPGVTVIIKGTSQGVITNIDGEFFIDLDNNINMLLFSFVGMKPQEIAINNRSIINVTMEEENIGLEEVVAIGYGIQKKETVTGAISTVSTEQLTQSPQANISNALTGRMTGLIAVQRSGEPGEDESTIRIRGIGTFTGSQDPLIMVDGIEAQSYNNIDPNEIESISILKDASATAVYGVRGANGVLLITTKRGKEGKPKISLTSNFAISKFANFPENMGSYDYTRLYNEALKYDSYITGGYTPRYSDDEIAKYKSGDYPILYPSTNWKELLIKPISSQMHSNFTLSGGTKKTKYLVSAGLFSQESLFKTEKIEDAVHFDPQINYKRYNFRTNFDFEVSKYFSIQANISSQIEEKRGFNKEAENVIDFIKRANPIDSPGIYDGKIIIKKGVDKGSSCPVHYMTSDGYHELYRNYLNGSVRFKYDFSQLLKGLEVHATFSYQNFVQQDAIYRNSIISYEYKEIGNEDYVLIPSGIESPFSYSEQNGKSHRVYFEMGMDYKKNIGEHYVTAMLLYKQSKYHSPSLAFLVSNGYQGLASRLTYDFKKRYLVEFSLGYEGTENFAEKNRFGFFPAASLGWVVSEEGFFPENDFISYFKLRGSIGQVGNDKVGDLSDPNSRFLYRPSSYSYGGGYYLGEVGSTYNYYTGSSEGKIGNPNLTWEKSTKLNIGFELNILKNKVQIGADWFNEKRNNILADKGTVPIIVGATLPSYNFGKMKNSGFECDILYRSQIRNFKYRIKVNYTYAHNVIEFQDEVTRTNEYQYRTGLRYGQYFGYVAEGLYNTWKEVNDANRPVVEWQNNKIQPGDIKYKDINNDGIINNDDIVPIGYSNFPEKTFGISFGGEYQGLTSLYYCKGLLMCRRVLQEEQILDFITILELMFC